MIWEVITQSVGDWIEVKIVVSRGDDDYSWAGQLMILPDEWQDFASRLGLRQDDDGTWRSR